MIDFELFYKYEDNIKESYLKSKFQDRTTNISKIISDDDVGKLYYRNIDINTLIKDNDSKYYLFEKVIFLLIFGFIPKKEDFEKYCNLLNDIRYSYFNSNYEKMNVISKNMMINIEQNILNLYDDDLLAEDNSFENVFLQCNNLIAKIQAVTFLTYSKYVSKYFNVNNNIILPSKNMSTSELILYLIKGEGKYTDLEINVLDIMLLLHAEHGGGNNSTYTNYVVTTSGTDTYSSMVASIASLKGSRHGGANIKVVQMVENFKHKYSEWSKENIEKYLIEIINKNEFDNSGLIYGIGHAMYNGEDPRTTIIKKQALILAKQNKMEKEYELYCNIEEIGKKILIKKNNYSKTICANIDFYSGFVYSLIGIPRELFTVLFVLSRLVGWSAHRLETIANENKLVRPKF